MKIRPVNKDDVKAICEIYNAHVTDGTATFETVPVTDDEMCRRVESISVRFPYYVAEVDGAVAGYCYVHEWKQRAAYAHTLETTVYIASQYRRRGIGMELMRRLIDECRSRGYHALVACITGGNDASVSLHVKLGFTRVSQFNEVGMKFGQWLGVTDYELIL
jgi:phosphinothricin acetyltransferase